MEIQYLGYLRDNPDANPNESEYKFTIEPIALEEIAALEQLYNNGNADQFLFIYLDEGEDPLVYEGLYSGGGVNFPDWIHSVSVKSLSELINHRIDRQKEGRNPF